MADGSQFKGAIDQLFKGMDTIISSKTVVGEAIHIGDIILLPLVDVSFAVGAGAFNGEKKDKGAGGMGGKIVPSAVLVIQNGTTRLVNIKHQDTINKIIDMVPEIVNKFNPNSKDGKKVTEEEVNDMLKNADTGDDIDFQ